MFGTAFVTPQEEDAQSTLLMDEGKCTTLIVGKDATAQYRVPPFGGERIGPDSRGKKGPKATGRSVLLAHNEDLGDNSAQHLIVRPRIQHEPGEVFELYSGGSIPQVEETYAYIASTIFDIDYIPGTITSGINEYQVAIGNNMTYSRDELIPPEGKWSLLEGGVIWTEFTQLALERAESAREAVEIMGHLSETCWLSGDPGTAFGIADPNEGWFIEIPREGQWVAKRVPDDGYAMMANCFRIGAVDFEDEEKFMYSGDLVNFAIERGFYDPASGPFNFAEAYGDLAKAEAPSNTRRHWRVESLLAGFAPEVTVEDVMSIMRDHYEGTEYDLTNGYEVSPHHTPERSICRTSTEVCIVAQLRNWLPAEIGGVAWWALSAPCSSVFVPWYMGILEVPYEYTIGTNVEDDESAYWAFNRLEGLVDAQYGDLIGDVREAWAEFEQEELAIQPIVEEVALKAYYEDSKLARQFLTSYSNALGIKAVNKARRIAGKLD